MFLSRWLGALGLVFALNAPSFAENPQGLDPIEPLLKELPLLQDAPQSAPQNHTPNASEHPNEKNTNTHQHSADPKAAAQFLPITPAKSEPKTEPKNQDDDDARELLRVGDDPLANFDIFTVPQTNSRSVLIVNAKTGERLYEKNIRATASIASITKLMTAMVVLDSGAALDELLTIGTHDIDRVKGTSSRLPIGTSLSRRMMLLLTLMSSENRAASALAQAYPGGLKAFVAKMNQKARQLGMTQTRFVDSTGLRPENRSTAQDLLHLIRAAHQYPLIREFSTSSEHLVWLDEEKMLSYRNTNALVREGGFGVQLSKTGYIREAGRCLVMYAVVGSTPMLMVFLGAETSALRTDDARMIKFWLETQPTIWLPSLG